MPTTLESPPRPPAMDPRAPRPRRPWSRWWRRGLGIIAILAALAIDVGAWAVIPILFVLVVPFEKLFPRHRGQRVRRDALGTDLAYAAATPALQPVGVVVAVVVGVASLAWLPGLALRPLVAAIPGTWRIVAGVALFDLAIYWAHRWSHEVPLLWRFHAVHHSTETLDWVSGFRAHPFDGAIVAPPFVLLLGAGFTPELAGGLAVVQVVLGIFLHANVSWRLRPLHRVVVTPEFHHWHHTNEPAAIHSNYSIFLPAWDLLFGTYFMPRDRRPATYGIDEAMPPTLGAQLLHPLRGMRPPWWFLRHPVRGARDLRRSVATGLGQVWRSTTRPTRTAPPAPDTGALAEVAHPPGR